MEFVWEIVKFSGAPIVDRVCEGKNLKRNYEKLNKDAKDLYDKREEIKEEITRGGERKRPKRECQGWLEEVEAFENKKKAIEGEYQRDKRWLWGWCPNVFWRMNLGRSVVEMMNQITLLRERSKFEGGVVVDTILSHDVVMTMPAPTIEAATSTDLTIQKIMECIKDEGIGKIGVYGKGGVGKTTIMKNLNNRKEIAEMFTIVIWVTVSQEWSLRKVQKEVAERLSLQLGNDASEDAVSQKIFQNLKTKTFLLLLDDVWEKIDLYSIGIPNPNQEKGCKVVLTTRSLTVCHQMETKKNIRVNVLSKEESWRLFHDKVGEVVDSPLIETIARNVVDECGRLPLAIIVVGASLREETNLHVWNNALTELRSPDASNIGDMEKDVFQSLEFSYQRLGNDNVKKCFLYGALYPEDYEINIFELIEHWREEGFIDVVGSLAEERNKGHAILKVLKDACLFESVEGKDSVKLHDVIRDLALRITSPKTEGHKFLVRAGLGVEEAPKEEEWKHIKKMSLMMNNHELFNLPDRPECPVLTTLFLQLNGGLNTISESFFVHMQNLRVLDLSGTDIECLPPSICNLVNLVALYLNQCRRLVGLPSQIGALKRLEVLNVDTPKTSTVYQLSPKINCLPTEIEELTHLRHLKVALRIYEGQTTIIPRGALSKLSLMEELSIWFSLNFHSSTPSLVDLMWDECAAELGRLTQLINLEFVFPTVECLEQFVISSPVWDNRLLTTFVFTVGYYTRSQQQDSPYIMKYRRIILIKYAALASPVLRSLEFICGINIPRAVVKVLNRSKLFALAYHSAVERLSEFGIENMSGLQYCYVFECNEMETLIDVNGVEVGEEGALPKLETLYMEFLPNLRSIWEGPVPPGSLNCLKNMTLWRCDKARKILSRDMIKQLSNLENLKVRGCSGIKEIVEEDTVVEVEHHLLPKLKTLQLIFLEKLERICCRRVQLALPSVESIMVVDCPELKSVFEGMVSLTSLRVLHMDGLRKVSKIFSREIIQQLSNLEELLVRNCPEIEEMVEEEMVEYHPLPKLKKLSLKDLPKLASISCKRMVPFGYPSLEFVRVIQCPNLKRLSLGVDNTTSIKKIEGDNIEWWEALEWEDDAIKHQLQPLFVVHGY